MPVAYENDPLLLLIDAFHLEEELLRPPNGLPAYFNSPPQPTEMGGGP
jgi:hypothetical protein